MISSSHEFIVAELTLFNIGVPGDDSESGLNIVVTNVIYADGLELITALQEGVTTSVVIEDISKEPVPVILILPIILSYSSFNHVNNLCFKRYSHLN